MVPRGGEALEPEAAIAQLREEVERGWWEASLVHELESLVANAHATTI